MIIIAIAIHDNGTIPSLEVWDTHMSPTPLEKTTFLMVKESLLKGWNRVGEAKDYVRNPDFATCIKKHIEPLVPQ